MEVQARRAGYEGEELRALSKRKPENLPPFLRSTAETDNPLPRLVMQGVLTNVQADAAERYARAHIRLWGRQAAPAARYEQYIPGDGPAVPKDQLHRYSAWQGAYSAIIVNGGGWPAYSALRLVVLEWRTVPDSRIPALRMALDALARHYMLRKAA